MDRGSSGPDMTLDTCAASLCYVFVNNVFVYHEFRHNVIKVVCGTTRLSPSGRGRMDLQEQWIRRLL